MYYPYFLRKSEQKFRLAEFRDICSLLRPFIHKRKDQNMSVQLIITTQLTAVVPLLRIYMHLFLVVFLGWAMLPHPQTTSTDHGGPRSSNFRLRGGEVTTSPLLTSCEAKFSSPEK